MLDIRDTAKTVLSEAETRLQDLSIQAMRCGDYEGCRLATDLAEDLRALASRLTVEPAATTAESNGHSAPPSLQTGGNGHSSPPMDSLSAAVRTRMTQRRSSRPAEGSPAASRRRRAPVKGEYPKFHRQGDTLVKVSWSKKEREEYQHKAPRRVVDLLAAAIARKASRTGRFTTEELFPLKDPQDGAEVPSYQAYVALAWLKASGAVKQKGKGGYTLKNALKILEDVASFWKQLQET